MADTKTVRPGTKNRKRGQERRKRILSTARALLADTDPDQLSLADIAERSDIPVSSLYHFYRDVSQVYTDIVSQFHEELLEDLMADFEHERFVAWQALISWLIQRTAAFYQAHPAFEVLILSGKAPARIKQTDRELDSQLGQALTELFQQHFDLPDIKGLDQIVYNAVEIVDLFFSLALRRNQTLTPDAIEEARRAAIAYLRNYFPEFLNTRGTHAT